MKDTKLTVLVLAVTSMMLLLAGCGSNEDANSPDKVKADKSGTASTKPIPTTRKGDVRQSPE